MSDSVSTGTTCGIGAGLFRRVAKADARVRNHPANLAGQSFRMNGFSDSAKIAALTASTPTTVTVNFTRLSKS